MLNLVCVRSIVILMLVLCGIMMMLVVRLYVMSIMIDVCVCSFLLRALSIL